MAKENSARAVLAGPMRFNATSGSGHAIVLDTNVADGGEDSGPSPMEALLMALAGCTGMDVISTLRKMRQPVNGYEIRVHGMRADNHPRVYTDISVEHIVTGRGVNRAAVERAVQLSETTYCGVGATLSKTAQVTHTITLVDD